MCDIWKDNQNLKRLTEDDIRDLLDTFIKFDTKQVVMSGGEALLNPDFFRFCEILKKENIKVTLLSTGLTLKRNVEQLIEWVNDIIVSLDGDELAHDRIRNIPGAYSKLKEGVQTIKSLNSQFRITARSVIQRSNFRRWPAIVESAMEIGLDQISFLPADVGSHAFNREVLWSDARQHEILPGEDELTDLKSVIEELINDFKGKFEDGFIAESPEKIRKIYSYYAAFYGLNLFPYKKCNAPWVSAVVEADGTVRPCFFHSALGNIHEKPLDKILNSVEAIDFRKNLDTDTNSTCVKCVCYLNLPPRRNPAVAN
jgi:MoaA/NifB/PqqE/SkfB family radical SAM enzyme